MAGPALMARQIVAWALRGTKQLSPERRVSKVSFLGKKAVGKKELRPWMRGLAEGDKSILGKYLKIGPEGRTKFVTGYTGTYKHLRKHKGKYGAGVAGAAIWDF